MLRILGERTQACDGLTRRALLQAGALSLLTGFAGSAASATRSARVRSVILIDLFGGPSHIDMFDPKPDAVPEIRGEFGVIRSALPGILVSEHLPRVSRWVRLTHCG